MPVNAINSGEENSDLETDKPSISSSVGEKFPRFIGGLLFRLKVSLPLTILLKISSLLVTKSVSFFKLFPNNLSDSL